MVKGLPKHADIFVVFWGLAFLMGCTSLLFSWVARATTTIPIESELAWIWWVLCAVASLECIACLIAPFLLRRMLPEGA